MNPLIVWALAFSLATSSASGGLPQNESLFEKGVLLYEQGKFAESIPYLEKALNDYPESSNILWNLGLASAAAGQHAKALTYWKRYRKVRFEDWRVVPKLIQTYQTLGRIKQRDEAIATLFRLREKTRDPKLKELPLFCREQFKVNGQLIMAYQFFEPSGEWMQFYRFLAIDSKGHKEFFVSLGSYESTTQISRELGEIKANERLYHFDGYYPGGLHKTFGFLKGETTPSYDAIRPAILEILEGKIEPSSSSQSK